MKINYSTKKIESGPGSKWRVIQDCPRLGCIVTWSNLPVTDEILDELGEDAGDFVCKENNWPWLIGTQVIPAI